MVNFPTHTRRSSRYCVLTSGFMVCSSACNPFSDVRVYIAKEHLYVPLIQFDAHLRYNLLSLDAHTPFEILNAQIP